MVNSPMGTAIAHYRHNQRLEATAMTQEIAILIEATLAYVLLVAIPVGLVFILSRDKDGE